jgi:hypothetical protein
MFEDKNLLSVQEVRSKVEKAYAAWQNTGKTNARRDYSRPFLSIAPVERIRLFAADHMEGKNR